MNGLEAAPVLRRLALATPIILYTLHADNAIQQQLETVQVDSIVSKREPMSRDAKPTIIPALPIWALANESWR
jgi:hypothetical protein